MDELVLKCEQELLDRIVDRLRSTYESLRDYGDKGRRGLRSDALENTRELLSLAKKLNMRENVNITNWCNRALGTLSRSAEDYRTNVFWRNETISDIGIILREMGQEFEEDALIRELSIPIMVQEVELNDAFAEL
jgi:hypothetical protein